MNDVYKQALCLFIQDGVLTLEQVKEKVRIVESTIVERSRQTPFWVSAEALCEHLNAGIVANSHKPFVLNVTNISSMEKLLRIDMVSEEEVRSMIDWCLSHDFWGTVIFSPLKFRKHYQTMTVQRSRDGAVVTRLEPVVNHPKVLSDEELYERKRQREAEATPMPEGFKRMIGLAR